jgi:hypothetical protein
MVCTFCSGDRLGGHPNHNVRTCRYLKASVAVFVANKGQALAQDVFAEELAGCGLALVTTGPLGAFAAACYSAYSTASKMINLATFVSMSKKGQAEFLLKNGFKFTASFIDSVVDSLTED